ncbi:M10 family metallopeptidase [Pacificoceanicola onchidii]|uniref:M10 family metallopeptidase n=1 Tax=Pacificoceanicola onchidii TaxID=2562685 RepID=UPI0010A5E621|nr:M10 family metallopeptidase [Pacificoceanicola onchidii]
MTTNIFELLKDAATELPHIEMTRSCHCPGCGGASIGPGTAGTGTAGAVTATLDEMANYLTTGFWGGPNDNGQWDTSASNVITVNISGLTAEGQQLARWALEAWESVADLQFVEVTSGGDITFQDNDSGAYAFWNSTNGYITSATVNVHWSWITEGATIDSYAFSTYIHEIGHALGLGHQGPYDGNATYGVDNIFTNDSWQMSVMSYFDQNDNTATNASLADVLTPMIVDIIAIQNLYGAPGASSETAGDTVWGANSTLGGYMGSFFNSLPNGTGAALYKGGSTTYTIYDRDGTDTLDLSYTDVAGRINLNDEAISDVGGLTGNLIIARGTVIENLTTGGGNDTVTGNEADNVIYTNGGVDDIVAGDGNDLVYSGAGNDRLFGGNGNDSLYGGSGHDLIGGAAGHDSLFGADGNDSIYAGSGNDMLGGVDGNDSLFGADGQDSLFGGNGNDTLGGVNGHDIAYGGNGDDAIYGGGGNDQLGGMAGSDTIYGGDGNDAIYGGSGNDLILGFADNDTIYGGTGNDTMSGGTGVDEFFFATGFGSDEITDFSLAEGDVLKLDDALWTSTHGTLSDAQIIAEFADIDASGNVILDFGGGNTITLTGVTSTTGLEAGIDIF